MDRFALILTIIGAIVLGIMGIFNFNLVAWAFHDGAHVAARIIYTIIGLSGLWCISLLFRERNHRRVEDM